MAYTDEKGKRTVLAKKPFPLDEIQKLLRWSLAPRVGFEPTTYRLTAECSAAELPRNRNI